MVLHLKKLLLSHEIIANFMEKKESITSDFPNDLRETYRLLLRHPEIWVPVVLFLLGAGGYFGNIVAKLETNESVSKTQEEFNAIRTEERKRCDEVMDNYQELVEKLTQKNSKNEK